MPNKRKRGLKEEKVEMKRIMSHMKFPPLSRRLYFYVQVQAIRDGHMQAHANIPAH